MTMPRPQFSLKSLLWLMAVVAAFLGGCGPPPANKQPPGTIIPRAREPGVSTSKATSSTDNYVSVSDLVVFHPGRSKDEVLTDVQWRGALVGACEDGRQSIVVIQFEITPNETAAEGFVCDAVFVNEEFRKFVPTQTGHELGIQMDDPQGILFRVIIYFAHSHLAGGKAAPVPD
jgi:hypothetical protein